ncbi:syntaxin-8-like [Phymastichus coffea]|uniref:syntaxin-8-like n=1 Tax=Phymastichus coffea TaxID=108790 RepID=UPI00273B14CC|nr:syntaxin-8-like [Phymastichus coffea]XP_058808097.1 syntaxin-8-like [Phymastichus coffea]
MTLVYIDGNDPWLNEYEACDNLFREIMEQLTLRNKESRVSQTYASLSAQIRIRLNQYSSQIRKLKGKVNEAFRQRIITTEEAERRNRQIEQLMSREIQIQKLMDSKMNELAQSRSRLFGNPSTSAFADGGTTNWGIDDNEEPLIDIGDRPSVSDLKAQKQHLLQQQEEGLEQLSKIISRQKQIAQTIHTEVDYHNEIIDDLADHMDRTDQRLIEGSREVRTVSRKDRVWPYWLIIIILFIIIIACALA